MKKKKTHRFRAKLDNMSIIFALGVGIVHDRIFGETYITIGLGHRNLDLGWMADDDYCPEQY